MIFSTSDIVLNFHNLTLIRHGRKIRSNYDLSLSLCSTDHKNETENFTYVHAVSIPHWMRCIFNIHLIKAFSVVANKVEHRLRLREIGNRK